MFHALYGTPVVSARLALVYGPEQAARKVIPSTILALLRGEAPRLSSAARPWDFVYVDDAVDALARLLGGGGPDGATVEIGTGRTEPLRAVIERIVRMIDPTVVPAFGAVADRPLVDGRAADAAATEKMLGWRASTTLERGLERTIDWYRTHADSFGKRGVPA
jgi:nucleoside-diphosphate-sugar epimerase